MKTIETYCSMAWDHNPEETCPVCGLETDVHGNTEADFLNCSFPDCGCDGARNCMSPNGANSLSNIWNIEKRSTKELYKRNAMRLNSPWED